MFTVEVAGFGVVPGFSPHAVYVICVQQQTYQAWTVYRRYTSFTSLCEQLRMLIPGIVAVPEVDASNLDADYLEQTRALLDEWISMLLCHPMILNTQCMYHFLCGDANLPPPYLEIQWSAKYRKTSLEEMEMDEMFEKHLDLGFDEDEQDPDDSQPLPEGFDDDDDGEEDEDEESDGKGNDDDDDDDDDGLEGFDVQSLSVGEAEFIYNPADGEQKQELMEPGEPAAPAKKKTINLDSFQILKVIGKGSFGKVFLVREKRTSTVYAMKVLTKQHLIKKNQVEHTKTERSVLGYVKHPYIVGLNMAFQTQDKLFFILDYCAGGELFFHLGKVGRFPETRAKFYTAEIVLALEHVHSLDIIYRDLKPENVLVDANGHVRLTDFGLSKEGVSDHSSGATSFCGTPEYIAPEVLLREGHGRAVDWWSLGALMYEMLTGLPPFYSRNRQTMFEKILQADLQFPDFVSPLAQDFLSKLLVRDPKLRLGSGERDAQEVMEHPIFADIDWPSLRNGEIPSPWVPTITGSLDTSQFDQEFTSMQPIISPDVRDAYLGELDNPFEGFSFVDESTMKKLNSYPSYRSMDEKVVQKPQRSRRSRGRHRKQRS